MELCWHHCLSRSTFRAWKAKYGEAIATETDRQQQLELENARLRKALVRAQSDLERLRGQSSGAPLLSPRVGSIESHRLADAPTRASGLHDAD
jgi:hypothetical protein